MSYRSICYLVLNLLWVNAFAQSRFNIVHDNNHLERSNAVIVGDSGKYICTGTSEARDYYTIGLNGNGTLAWSILNSCDDRLNNSYGEISHSLISSSNFFYVIGGAHDSTERAVSTRILKIDWEGKLIWSKFVNGGYNDWGMDIQAFNDSEFVTLGYFYPDTSKQKFDLLIMYIDSSGIIKSQKAYGGSKDDYSRRFCISKDKKLISTGYTYSFGTGYYNAFLLKTHHDGKQAWFKTYGGSMIDMGNDVIELHNGNYLLAGNIDVTPTDIDAFIVLTDTSGTEVGKYIYGSPAGYDEFSGVGQLPGGNILVCGNTQRIVNGQLEQLGMAMRINENDGKVIWQRFYKHPPSTENYFYDMALTPDGGMVMTGMTIFTDGRKNDFWVVKVDSLGCDSLNCIVTEIDDVEVQKIGELKIYPNPSSGPITVQAKLPLSEKQAKLIIYDIQGKELEHRSISSKTETFSILPKGVLLFSLFIEGQLHDMERVLIE